MGKCVGSALVVRGWASCHMGECGCGKTHLIRYLCAWLRAELLILDVHGGTSEQDIVRVFAAAEGRVTEGAGQVSGGVSGGVGAVANCLVR